MGYLTVTRREGQHLRLTIDPGVDTEKLLQHLLRDGITITLGTIDGNEAKVSVDAPKEILIMRDELIEPPAL
jgi:carbon storage regulator